MQSRRSVVTALGAMTVSAGCVSRLREVSEGNGGGDDEGTRERARASFEPFNDEHVDGRYTVRVSVQMGNASEVILEQDGDDAGTLRESTEEAELLVDGEEPTRVEAIAIYPDGDRETIAEECFDCG